MQEFFDPSLNVSHFAFGDVGSTNDEAFRLAEDRGLDICFVTAKRQLKGRGRRGRPWVSEAGNLYTSIFVRAPSNPSDSALLSFVAAVSLREAIIKTQAESDLVQLQLKWPNDLLWDGAKIAGILLEAWGTTDNLNVVIGMGTNIAHHPSDTPYPATNLIKAGFSLKPDDLFQALKTAFMSNFQLWNGGSGFDVIRRKWLKAAIGLNEKIEVRLESETVHGIFDDLNAEGQLVLKLSNGQIRQITAGDVFFGQT